jgi:molybdopterin converting factor small subunit
MMATLLYFAWVRERIGTADESLSLPSDVSTAGALLDLLIARGGGYAEALGARDKIRIAVRPPPLMWQSNAALCAPAARTLARCSASPGWCGIIQ